MLKRLKDNKLLLVLIIAFLIIIINFSFKIVIQKELFIDKLAYDILVEKLRNPGLTAFMKTITKLSDTKIIVTIAIIFSILFASLWKKKRLAIIIPTNLGVVALINQFLKFLFKRPRPIGYRLIEMTGYSFPSGHAMVSMAFYGLLIYFIYNLIKNKYLKVTLIVLNILIISLIGISRVYLGVHYLSDVLTGYSISIIYLLIVTRIINKNKKSLNIP